MTNTDSFWGRVGNAPLALMQYQCTLAVATRGRELHSSDSHQISARFCSGATIEVFLREDLWLSVQKVAKDFDLLIKNKMGTICGWD